MGNEKLKDLRGLNKSCWIGKGGLRDLESDYTSREPKIVYP